MAQQSKHSCLHNSCIVQAEIQQAIEHGSWLLLRFRDWSPEKPWRVSRRYDLKGDPRL